MSVRLIRQASETPNITNRDDSRMTRFAYGGIDGVVKGYGNELAHNINGSTFVLRSGCIVLQGWEVMVDSWELDLSTVVNTQYHTVYLEVNIASETAEIKSSYQTGSFPTINSGNDLTTYPNGTARLPLYTFTVTSGRIFSVTKKFIFLSYYGDRFKTVEADIDSIEQRLDKLGFKEGSVIAPDSTSTFGSKITSAISALNRQGNYVIGVYDVSFNDMEINSSVGLMDAIGTIPAQFLPNNDLTIMGITFVRYGASGVETGCAVLAHISVDKSTGKIYCSFEYSTTANYYFMKAHRIVIHFGYEAAPLT